MVLLASLIAATSFAQSFQWHQSYDNNQKFVADFYYGGDKYNLYSYNEFTVLDNQAYGFAVAYGEYKIGESNFYIHPEVRFRIGSDPAIGGFKSAIYPYGTNMTNIGFAYMLNIGDFTTFVTPMYRYDFGSGSNWQLSFNSSMELGRLYYESYIDFWGPSSFNFCTEQKFYWMFNEVFALGVNAMVFNLDSEVKFVPFLVARISTF